MLHRARFTGFLILALSAIALATVLTACQPSTPTPPAGGAPAATAAPASGAAPTAAPAKPAVREKLTIAQMGEPPNLDPTTGVQTPSRMLFTQIFDSLMHRAADGKLVPKLAEKWERVDNNTIRFSLRKGVKFHNGEEFNAESVKFSMARYADPKSQAANTVATIKEVKVVDPFTVDFITKEPDPILLAQAADMWFMVPPKYFQEKTPEHAAANPVGTGPFVFKEQVKGDHVTVVANKDYWGGAPKVQQVIWRTIPEDSTRVAALERGELDIAIDLPPAMSNDLKKNSQISISTAADPSIIHIGFKMSVPLVQDKRIRQALNYAVNKPLLIERVLFGYATAAGQVGAPGTFGHNPDVKAYPYDPDKAKQLLAEAGKASGLELTMDVPIGGVNQSKEVAQAIAGDWEKVGVKAKISMIEFATMNSQKLLVAGRPTLADTYMWWKRAPTLDTGQVLNTGFLGDQAWNYGMYKNAQVDEQIKKQGSTLDEKVRQTAIYESAKLMYDDAPVVWLYWPQWVHGARKGVNYQARNDGLIYVFDEVTFN